MTLTLHCSTGFAFCSHTPPSSVKSTTSSAPAMLNCTAKVWQTAIQLLGPNLPRLAPPHLSFPPILSQAFNINANTASLFCPLSAMPATSKSASSLLPLSCDGQWIPQTMSRAALYEAKRSVQMKIQHKFELFLVQKCYEAVTPLLLHLRNFLFPRDLRRQSSAMAGFMDQLTSFLPVPPGLALQHDPRYVVKRRRRISVR